MATNMQGVSAQYGHIDWAFDTGPWYDFANIGLGVDEPLSLKSAFWFLGPDADGPLAACLESAPNPSGTATPAHSHDSDQVRVIVSGSIKIGTTWYTAGDVRFQQADKIYGPEVVGPEGCREVLFFNRRSAIIPQYVGKAEPPSPPGAEAFLEQMAELSAS
jgi:hypothetical protein